MRRVLAGVLLVGALAGCSSGGGSSAALSGTARGRLQTDVLEVTRAAAQHDPAQARAALGILASDLAALQKAGSISAQRAAQISALIARVQAELTAQTSTAPTTKAPPATTPAPHPKPPPPDPHGKHHGHGGDGGGDGG